MGMSNYVLDKEAEAAAEIELMAKLEERERCAKIAENYWLQPASKNPYPTVYAAIAAAIRETK